MFIRNSLTLAACLMISATAMADAVTPSQVGNLGRGVNQAPNGFLTVNYGSNDYPNIGLLQFDLSAYAGDTIGSATLDLFHMYNSAPGAVFALYANTSAWTPSAGFPANGPSILSTPVAEITINDNNQSVWRSADLTTIVNEWTSGSLTNYGLTLERVDAANPLVYFTSGESATPVPTLSLTGVVSSVPEPGNLTLLLAGLATMGFMARRRAANR